MPNCIQPYCLDFTGLHFLEPLIYCLEIMQKAPARSGDKGWIPAQGHTGMTGREASVYDGYGLSFPGG